MVTERTKQFHYLLRTNIFTKEKLIDYKGCWILSISYTSHWWKGDHQESWENCVHIKHEYMIEVTATNDV